ncbi:MAG: hypothetical protein PUP91_31545 [Rhizonema sp. PD37]|nr:hypothetical protein [Rhizonema sp. PD37]
MTFFKNAKTQDLLNAVLSGKTEEFQRRVLDVVVKTGLEPDDPVFLVLLATGRLEVLLEDSPQALERLFKGWTNEIKRTLDLVEQTTLEQQKSAIAVAAGDLIRQAERKEARRFFTSLIPAMAVLLCCVGIGVLLGITVPGWMGGGLTKERRLTVEEAEALRWAQSKEGRFARNLMKWNSGSLDNLDCTQDVKRLGVTLEVAGRPSVAGFCTIWVQPPDKRQFKK